MEQFPLTILPNNDGTYTVLSPIFNIITEWDTLEDAINNGKDAISCHINWYKNTPDKEWESFNNFKNSFTTFVAV